MAKTPPAKAPASDPAQAEPMPFDLIKRPGPLSGLNCRRSPRSWAHELQPLRRPLLSWLVLIYLASAVELRAGVEPVNLTPDASFESPLRAWFSEEGKGEYFAGKEQVADAPDGKHVMVIQGWEKSGSRILSPVFDLAVDGYSGTAQVRSSGQVEGATLELALLDEKGVQKLASFFTTPVDGKGQWRKLEGLGVKLSAPAARGRLALVLTGPQAGARVEVDLVGLYAGTALGTVTDNADFACFEAEELADGGGWKARDHFEGWYQDLPSRMKMLDGSDAIADRDNHPVRKTLAVRRSGPHRLWVRLLRTHAVHRATYTVALHQQGAVLASREIDNGDPRLGADWTWVWVALDANLMAGEVEVVLSRPTTGASISRKIDLFALTDLLDYAPTIQDFRPKGYLRWTNRSQDPEPFCLWMFIHRNQGPLYYMNVGMLSAAGFSGECYVPADQAKWLAPGQSSPWVGISQYLVPRAPNDNHVQLIATRGMHTNGYVTNAWRGALEFAVGEERRLVRTIEVEQSDPRILLALPYDFERAGDQIYTALDYIGKSEAVLDKIGPPRGRVAEHLDLNTILGFETGTDDRRVIEREIGILKRLGFNGTYTPVANPKDAVAFCASHGLRSHFGMICFCGYTKNDCNYQPDVEKIRQSLKREATRYAPILDKVELINVRDEPGGPPYTHFKSCDYCKSKFAGDLKLRGLTPAALGVEKWEQVVPVLPDEKEKYPELFYYTGLFRLQSFANLMQVCVAEKKKLMPARIKAYANYSPHLTNGQSMDQMGTDLFLLHRNGGLEMGWTEDWPAWGIGPQHMSTMYALLRAAGAPEHQPLGGYMVGTSGSPLLQRIKYYVVAAAGARHISVYSYGPAYATIDSWSLRYDLYPVLSAVQHELGVIDEALHGTTRHPTEIAILYNRTSGIWAYDTAVSEPDAYFIRGALVHAGYDADFIPEEDVEAGQLDRYKVLYLNGPQLRRATASKIADWVRNGGVLFGDAGAGSRDEFNRPNPELDEVFGARSQGLALEHNVGRPRYELRTQPVLDVLKSAGAADAPAVTFNQLGYRETLVPLANATVFLKNQPGEPAGVMRSFGKGTAIRVAGAPGIAYFNDAVSGKDYDIESYLPKKYRRELRDFIAWPAKLAKVFRVAETISSAIPEIVRYDGKDRAVIFIIDYNATPVSKFAITLPRAGPFNHAYSASGQPVQMRSLKNRAVEISLPLNVADAVVLEKLPWSWRRLLNRFHASNR